MECDIKYFQCANSQIEDYFILGTWITLLGSEPKGVFSHKIHILVKLTEFDRCLFVWVIFFKCVRIWFHKNCSAPLYIIFTLYYKFTLYCKSMKLIHCILQIYVIWYYYINDSLYITNQLKSWESLLEEGLCLFSCYATWWSIAFSFGLFLHICHLKSSKLLQNCIWWEEIFQLTEIKLEEK